MRSITEWFKLYICAFCISRVCLGCCEYRLREIRELHEISLFEAGMEIFANGVLFRNTISFDEGRVFMASALFNDRLYRRKKYVALCYLKLVGEESNETSIRRNYYGRSVIRIICVLQPAAPREIQVARVSQKVR